MIGLDTNVPFPGWHWVTPSVNHLVFTWLCKVWLCYNFLLCFFLDWLACLPVLQQLGLFLVKVLDVFPEFYQWQITHPKLLQIYPWQFIVQSHREVKIEANYSPQETNSWEEDWTAILTHPAFTKLELHCSSVGGGNFGECSRSQGHFHIKDIVIRPKGWLLYKPVAHAYYRQEKQRERGQGKV